VRRGRGDYQPGRLETSNLGDRDGVVTKDPDLLPQLAEVLHEIVGEGVVVIDHEQHISVHPVDFCSVECLLPANRYPLHLSLGWLCRQKEQGHEVEHCRIVPWHYQETGGAKSSGFSACRIQ
jgi:hypothetical protein